MTASVRRSAGSREADLVLEREREIETIASALDAVQMGRGAALVVEGEAGIGKSTLLRVAVDAAVARGLRVLRAQGGELERELPYGTVIELFGSLTRDERRSAELFSGPAAVAASLLEGGADARTGPGRERPDPFAYLHGLFWLVLNLVEQGPLVLVVDDTQWADEPSLRFLHRLVERIEELPAVVILAMRPDHDLSTNPDARQLRASRAATHLVLDPLSEVAVGELMDTVAGGRVDPGLRRQCWEATRGNPFFATELASELSRAGFIDEPAAQIAEYIPDRVGRFVEARLSSAGPDAVRLAESIAVLGEHATLHRASSVADIDPAAALDAARRLVDAGILDEAAAVAFRHPIVRTSVYASVPGPVRASLHRRAALLLADEGVDIGVVGTQLREAEPAGDARVIELLLAAADEASGRGEPEVAVALHRRALDEPPGPHLRELVLIGLARAEAAAGSPTAPATFGEALAIVEEPARRAALRLELGHALVGGGQWVAAREAFELGLGESSELDAELRTALEAGALSSGWVTMENREAIGARVDRVLASEELGPANRELAVWIAFQQGAVVASTAREMGGLVRRAFSEAPVEVLVRQGQAVEVGAGLLLETDELEFEIDVLTRALAAARTTGPIGKAGVYAYCRAWPNYYTGRLTDAIADAEESLRAAELGWETFVPAGITVAALARIERDELDEAERLLDVDLERWAGRIDTAMLVPLAAGRLALARGHVPAALAHLTRAREGSGAAFMRNNVPTEWRTWLAAALVALDRRDEAREITAEGLEIARSWGAQWPTAAALRGAAQAEGGPPGLALLREAHELLRDSPARLERARVLVDLGSALRRNGSLGAAREVLAEAADLSRHLGARALLGRARAELRAAGARPRRVALSGVDSLTPAERRVAQEAMAGRTNREIAQALFVTPKAVEFHLANAYRKLQIGSRGELAGVMDRGDGA